MKFKLVVISLIMLGSSGSALAFPPVRAFARSVTVVNQLDHAVSDNMVPTLGTAITSSINPIPPGSYLFKDEGNSYYPPGFTLTIGDAATPSAQCLLEVSFPKPVYTLKQPGDGSAGFTCHLTAADTLVIAKI